MADNFQLCDMAEDAIARLEAEGVKLGAQDILTIQRLGLAAQGDCDYYSGGRSVDLGGGVWLHPLTIAGREWLDEFERAYPGDDQRQAFAFAYALAHGRTGFSSFGRESWPQVRAWRRRLNVTVRELSSAVSAVVGDIGAPEDIRGAEEQAFLGPDAWEDWVLMCCALVGGDPDAWRHKLSIPQIRRLIEARISLNNSEGRKSKDDPKLAALRDLAKFEDELRRRKGVEVKPDVASD